MEKKPHWIGHRTAERRQTESGYVYSDPDNQSLAIMIGVPGFHGNTSIFDGANLWEIDRYVEGLEANADPAAEKFREALNAVRELYRSGDLVGEVGNSKDWKSLRAHAEIINAGMRAQALSETPSPVGNTANNGKVHTLKRRTNALDAVIKMAKTKATDPDDYQSVWAALVQLAQGKGRPAPLTGYAEAEGVLYQDGENACKSFTKQALRKRMNPRAR